MPMITPMMISIKMVILFTSSLFLVYVESSISFLQIVGNATDSDSLECCNGNYYYRNDDDDEPLYHVRSLFSSSYLPLISQVFDKYLRTVNVDFFYQKS